jgi:hypothetical protein
VFFKVRDEAEDIINTLSTITSVIDCASSLLQYFEFYGLLIMAVNIFPNYGETL